MAEIDGQYEGPSVGRALQRSKYKKAVAEKEGGGSKESESGGAGHEKLPAVHPHAKGAEKSFHAYLHPGGVVHAHTHDHNTGEHEHREHPDVESAAQHMHEHMGAGEELPPDINEEAPGAAEGMESMGLGAQPPEEG